MKMSWIHSSRGAILGVLLACSLVAVGTAAAVSVSGGAPAPAENGTEVSMTVTVEDPFASAPDQWTLRGETQLQDATWNVEVLNQGRLVTRTDTAGSNFSQPLDFEEGATTVNVTLTGTVPALNTFDYENRSAENYTVMHLTQSNGNAIDQTWRSHRFTAASQDARQAIDAAADAVEEAGGTGDDDLQQAINAYDAGNFDNAESLADDAQTAAEESQGGLPIVLIGGVVVVLLLVAGGGYYYYQSQQGGDYKLQ
jgi:hypothetical protein